MALRIFLKNVDGDGWRYLSLLVQLFFIMLSNLIIFNSHCVNIFVVGTWTLHYDGKFEFTGRATCFPIVWKMIMDCLVDYLFFHQLLWGPLYQTLHLFLKREYYHPSQKAVHFTWWSPLFQGSPVNKRLVSPFRTESQKKYQRWIRFALQFFLHNLYNVPLETNNRTSIKTAEAQILSET